MPVTARRSRRAQANTIIVLVSVAAMAIFGWMAMSFLSSGLFRTPSSLMITIDNSIVAEDVADMMVNNRNLLAYAGPDGKGPKEAGVVEILRYGNKYYPRDVSEELRHPDYMWRISIVDLTRGAEDGMARGSKGLNNVDWVEAAETSRHVTLVRGDESPVQRNPGRLTLTLYTRKED